MTVHGGRILVAMTDRTTQSLAALFAVLVLAVFVFVATTTVASAHAGHAAMTSASEIPAGLRVQSHEGSFCRSDRATGLLRQGWEHFVSTNAAHQLPQPTEHQLSASGCCGGALCHGAVLTGPTIDASPKFQGTQLRVSASRFVWQSVNFGLMRPPRS